MIKETIVVGCLVTNVSKQEPISRANDHQERKTGVVSWSVLKATKILLHSTALVDIYFDQLIVLVYNKD